MFFVKKLLWSDILLTMVFGAGWDGVSHFVPIKTSIKHIYLKNYDQPIGNYPPPSCIQYDINQETAMSPRLTLDTGQQSPNFTQMLKL